MPHSARPEWTTRRRHGCYAVLAVALMLLPGAHARAQRSGDFSMTYTQERARFVGDQPNQYFYLRGATVGLGYNLWHGLGLAVNGTGLAGTNLRGTIDIHHVNLLVGPRYTLNFGHITPTAWNRKGSIFVEGKVGYTFATAGLYPSTSGALVSNASALDMEAGIGGNLHVYQRFDLRVLEVDLVRTQLPNGVSNVQNTFRIASGINFHLGY
jgi:hypothetical protein